MTCPTCEHEPSKPQPVSHVRFLLKRPQLRPFCAVRVEDVSGWGTMPCFCTDPFHAARA